jgi:glycosyltransferase involved in cell wall biosynthesis
MKMSSQHLPTIDVVIPAKNEEKWIRRVIENVQQVHYPRELLSIVVVDNGSHDQTKNICQQFDGVKMVSCVGSIAAARNYGAKKTSGDVIAFLDADCLPPAHWLERSTHQLENGFDVVSAVIDKDPDHVTWIERCWVDYLNAKYDQDETSVKSISSFCFVIARATMIEVDWFDETLLTCEDSDLGYRLHQNGKKLIVDKTIQTAHLRNAKTCRDFFLRQIWQGRFNFRSASRHGFEWTEFPTLAAPVAFLALVILMPLAFAISIDFGLMVLLAVICFPLTIAAFKRRSGQPKSLFQFTAIWSIYLFARGLAPFTTFTRHWNE